MCLRRVVRWLFFSFLCTSALIPHASEAQEEDTADNSARWAPQPSFTSEVAVEAVVDSSRVPLNRNLTLTIKVSCTGDISHYAFQWPNPPDLDRFDIVGSSSANIVRDEGGHIVTVKEFRYILKPVGEGQGRIGAVLLHYTDKISQKDHSLSTRAVGIEITEPVIRGTGGMPATPYLLIGLAVIILSGGGFVYLRKKKEKKEMPIPEIEAKSPEEIALEKLENAPRLRVAGETKEYYSAISNSVRSYIDRKFFLRTLELTTHDIVNSLKLKEVDEETILTIEKILTTCDMVKFARHEPAPSDLDQILTLAQNFFKTRMQISSTVLKEHEKEDIDSQS